MYNLQLGFAAIHVEEYCLGKISRSPINRIFSRIVHILQTEGKGELAVLSVAGHIVFYIQPDIAVFSAFQAG